jgi:CLIP-associating protein 1/2
VYEDPFVDNQTTTPAPTFTVPVLEDKPVNEDAANLQNVANGNAAPMDVHDSPEKARQNSRLLDSGISKIKVKSLEVHGFRKLQSLLRDTKTVIADDKFEALLLGLFQFLEDPLSTMSTDKAQDVKAQILATIKLLLKRERENFKPHVSKCLESLLETRSAYDHRAHIVSGIELLSDELVLLGDPSELVVVLGQRLADRTDSTIEGCRALNMGLHVLKVMLEKRDEVLLGEGELTRLATLAGRCIESNDSGVRMEAVQLCVALHARTGETQFWESMKDVKDDPKSLITYYIVRKQRELGAAA